MSQVASDCFSFIDVELVISITRIVLVARESCKLKTLAKSVIDNNSKILGLVRKRFGLFRFVLTKMKKQPGRQEEILELKLR
jgi:hypothetical protein